MLTSLLSLRRTLAVAGWYGIRCVLEGKILRVPKLPVPVQATVVASTQLVKYEYQYLLSNLKYQYQYQYWSLKYKYKLVLESQVPVPVPVPCSTRVTSTSTSIPVLENGMLKYSSSTSTQYYNPGSCVYPNSQSALVTGQDTDVLVVLMSRTLIGHTNVR